MIMKKIILLLIVTLLVADSVRTQEYWELETVIPPEVSHFKVGLKSDVGSTGALNISIPLLTVPGRGGLDFPITLGYAAGIKTRQQASWVGLGWNLDFGSITRVVRLLPDYDSVRTEKLNHDYSDYYLVSLPNFSSVMNQMDTIRTNPPKFVLENTNSWKVFATYKSYSGLRIPFDNDYSHNWDSAYYIDTDQWKSGTVVIFDNNPFNGVSIGHRDTAFRDIDKFVLTSPDGFRYVFGMPLRSEDRMNTVVMEYNSNWRLTAILGPDYVDGGKDSLNPCDSNEVGCKGSWIYFKYRNVENMRLRKYDNPNLLMQVTYPDTIYTPLHKLVFYTSERIDVGFAMPEPYSQGTGGGYPFNAYDMGIKPRKLDSLRLFERATNKKISGHNFVYASRGDQFCQTYNTNTTIQGVNCDSLGKLKLIKITPTDTGSTSENSYLFEYHKFNPRYFICHEVGMPYYMPPSEFASGWPTHLLLYDAANQYYRYRQDRFGYLYGLRNIAGSPNELSYDCARTLVSDSLEVFETKGAVAYSLKKITYPTGGYETYEYESNQFDPADKNTSKWGLGFEALLTSSGTGMIPNEECGIRLKRKTMYSIDGQSTTINYQYSIGHLSSPPITAHRHFPLMFRMFDWGKNVVEYEWVQEVYSDSSKAKKVFYRPNSFFYNTQRLFESEMLNDFYVEVNAFLLIETSQDWRRGALSRVENIGANNKVIKSSDYTFTNAIKDSMKSSYVGISPSSTYYTTMYSGLVLKNAQIDSTYDQSGNSPITKNTSFVYTTKGFPRVTTEFNSDGRMKKTVNDFMLPDSVSYSGVALDMYNKNMYSSVKAKKLYQDDTLKNYTEYNYKVFDGAGLKRIYIDKKYQWRDNNTNNVVDSGELLTTTVVDSLDNYGNPLIVSDANGVKSYFTWYQNSKLSSKTKFNQKVSYTYNPFHQVRSIIDENNNETRYIYDNFWRLRQIIGPDGKILKEYQYNYKK